MRSQDIALLVQIGTYERWEELRPLALNFLRLKNLTCDVYLNVVADEELFPAERTQELLAALARDFPGAIITTTPDRGMDIGGFMRQLQSLVAGERSYQTLFKLHTKTVEPWTSDLCAIMASPEAIEQHCKYLDEQGDVGLVGSNRWLIPMFQGTTAAYEQAFRIQAAELGLRIVDPGSEWRKEQARQAPFDWRFYVERHRDLIPAGVDDEAKATVHWREHGIDELRVPHARFINELAHAGEPISKFNAGTIFCCRAAALLPFFEDFDFERAYLQLETGHVKDGNGTLPRHTHAWERLFCLIVENAGYRLHGA